MLGSMARSWLWAPTQCAEPKHERRGLAGFQFVARICFSISLGLAVTSIGSSLTASENSEPTSDCSCAPKSTNLVFIIDRSGSLQDSIPQTPGTKSQGRGQTYNVEIEGVRCALRDPSVIPRDGSVSVGVVLFDGTASVPLPLTPPISSDLEAQALAAQIEALRCAEIDPTPCTSGDTNFDAAIREAAHIAQSRSADRRLLILSTDGEATDPDKGRGASAAFLQDAMRAGIQAELNVILIGLDNTEVANNSGIVSRVVVPAPPNGESTPHDPPGAVEEIKKSTCNEPGNMVFGTDCDCQVRQFAGFTRRALRSNVASLELTVNTLDDPAPNTPVPPGSPLSLRQAIEIANRNGGRAKITFLKGGGTIHPRIPLPALSAPDITICGCAEDCAASIPEKVTCPPASQSAGNDCERMVTIDGQIDSQRKLADGIVIRSNRDGVRGLRIINFSHAGIVIQPICLCDNTGFNRIELNQLENNNGAGVCVLDPPRDQVFAVTHNIGNTISMNDISGSDTPIDLACDGRTSNDAGDPDVGPNTLLNYPESFTVDTAGNTVTITGTVVVPTVDCPVSDTAIVEVFAVTKIRPESSRAAVDAVTFFGKITIDEKPGGAFSMIFTGGAAFNTRLADGSMCPIDGYTATFTDRAGNTSELIPFCTGPPRPKLSTQSIEFKRVNPRGEPNSTPQSEPFTIENCGCSRFSVTLISILRGGQDVGRLINPNDSDSKKGSGFFSVKEEINDAGGSRETRIPIPTNNIAIDPGTSQRFSIEFNPVIPHVIFAEKEKSMGGLFAKHVLPSDLMSTLNIKVDSGSLGISLIGHVTTAVKLIDPDTPSNPAKVTLTRSGDEFIVTFSVFDSNLDVNHLSFQFLDGAGGTVPLEQSDDDLTQVIRDRNLVTGQSFTVIKRFSNAKKHKEVSIVRVTVSDGETSVSATSDPVVSLSGAASAQPLRDGHGSLLILPIATLAPSSADRAPGERRTTARKENRR